MPISLAFTAIPHLSVVDHFSVRDVVYTPEEDIVTIVVVTDIPCHLYCRQTSRQPWIHKKPSLRRGVAFAEDVRFCFTVYEDHNQEEAGDTLIHTFIKPGWAVCTTRWLYFWATIADVFCPSTSSIFRYHNAWVPPPLPELSRYAWARNFSRYGAIRIQAVGTGLAATFHITDALTWAHHFDIFTRNREDTNILIALYEADEDNKPTGPFLGFCIYNLENGVEDGGDGATNPVYRHTVPFPWAFESNKNYCLVLLTQTGSAEWWITFRNQGWIGPKDGGTENQVTEHVTWDVGTTWLYAHPGWQCYEAWGYVF